MYIENRSFTKTAFQLLLGFKFGNEKLLVLHSNSIGRFTGNFCQKEAILVSLVTAYTVPFAVL